MRIIELLDKHIGHIKMTPSLARKIYNYRFDFVVTNSSHGEFFGNNLIGVSPLNFKTLREEQFFSDILGIEKSDILDNLGLAPAIVPGRKVTGDVFNLVLFYLARKARKDKKLAKKYRKQMSRDCILIFNYRTIAALHSKGFKFFTSEEISKIASDKLSNQYILRRLGTWYKYMEYRTDRVFDKRGKELKRLLSGKDDEFLAVIVKAQGAIRSTFKLLYRNLLSAIEESEGSTKRSLKISIDGNDEIADITTDVPSLINSTLSKLSNKDTFIDEHLMNLVVGLVPNYEVGSLRETLTDFNNVILTKEGRRINDYFSEVLSYELATIREGLGTQERGDLSRVLTYIKGVIVSSRSSNRTLLDIRRSGARLISGITKKRNKQFITKTRIALMLYILVLSYK